VPSSGVHGNAQWDVALRLLIVLSVAGFIGLAAGLYEIDRREKSTPATAERNFAEIQQRVQILSNQIHILTDQFTAQLIAKEVQLQALNGEVQALRHQCESRLKELEDALRVRRLEPGPDPR
jgi:cell division protein FtsB